ncbi:hypothetical protein EUGRSUZ_C00821 [Eucalyptus grandis]|uniref:Uncharacterized protein n=2 Tax=Eucalyptus grandis TaxID=71139 RepID=A0ACC3LBK9_EUCGR|nr:hypothetical protein EUGRSUZ_C00821 [Eucalyptus grandis]
MIRSAHRYCTLDQVTSFSALKHRKLQGCHGPCRHTIVISIRHAYTRERERVNDGLRYFVCGIRYSHVDMVSPTNYHFSCGSDVFTHDTKKDEINSMPTIVVGPSQHVTIATWYNRT